MDKIFLTVLNMNFTANFVIAVIIIARLFLNKMPKIISYILWIAAGFRLVFPFSFESVLSLMPVNTQPIPQDIVEQAVPRIDTGISVIDDTVSNILPIASQVSASVNILQIMFTAGSIIWLAGIAVMLVYSSVSMFMLKRSLKNAVLLEDNIYKAKIKTPFVTGFFKPKIYVPIDLADNERDYIILHERTHIKRRDNFIKLFSYLVLSLHWFNPLVWAAFILMSMDMEMSCDESVLAKIGKKTKKAYSMSILSLATEQRHTINIYPLAFGEGDAIRRIKNVLNYKKHSKIKIAITFIMVIALTAGLTLNSTISAKMQENNDFELAVEFLDRLYFFAEEDISEDNIAREEMAFFAAGLHNASTLWFYMQPRVQDGSPITIDYNRKDYGEAVKYCIENGIMDSDWFSDANTAVTLQDAVKIFITALGYEVSDDDYIAKALTQQVRLLGKHAVFPFTGIKADKILTKNDAIMLVYNYMMSEYAIERENKTSRGEYKVNEDGNAVWIPEVIYIKSVLNTFSIHLATPSSAKITVDGKEIVFDAYNIDGNNYFKIRDIAYILNGTSKQFNVTPEYLEHNGESYEVSLKLEAGKPYTAVGGEMAEKGTKALTAHMYLVSKDGKANNILTFSRIEPDGTRRLHPKNSDGTDGYIINGESYYKLRYIAASLDFSVSYDSAKDTVAIDTSKPYIS